MKTYVEIHKYYLCIKFDIVFKISFVVLFIPLYPTTKIYLTSDPLAASPA